MNDLIYNQRNIPKNQWRYGFRSSAAVGCGWIATHNALRLMGYRVDIPELIRYYELQLPLIHGNGGTSIFGPAVLFTQWSFPVTPCLRRERFNQVAKDSDVCILFYRWRQGWKLGAHFVALRHTDRGFVGYNTYRSSTGPDFYGESLEAFLDEKKYYGAVLFGIRDRRKTT
ncbi:MAG: hypothetical protein IJ001_10485 [Oscillospiraceae bacterium]|nr:hypothetical protein [Oscillospiraceae bacterium]